MKIEINDLVLETIRRNDPGSVEQEPTVFLRYRNNQFFITIYDFVYLAKILEAAYPKMLPPQSRS